MIQRSLQASVEGLKAAEKAFISKFSTQQQLADALRVTRQPVSRFFNRKPIDKNLFVQICEKLGLKWEEVADFLQSELEESLQNSDVLRIKLDAYHAEVQQDWELAKQLWIRVNVAAGGSDMQAIEAFSRIAQRQGLSSVPPKSSQPITLPTVERSVVVESVPTAHQAGLQVSQFDVVKLNGSRQEVKPDSNKAQHFTEDLGNGDCLKIVEIPDCTRNNTVQLEKYPLLVKRLISFAAHRLANSAEHRESQIRGEIAYENWLTNQLLMETPTMQRVQELRGYEASVEKVIKDVIKDPRYIDSQLRIRECQIQLQALKRSAEGSSEAIASYPSF